MKRLIVHPVTQENSAQPRAIQAPSVASGISAFPSPHSRHFVIMGG
jgi:hypothetical protein